MLLEVMREVKNFFQVSEESGQYKIEDGRINLRETYPVGSYILVTGSIMNNDVYEIYDRLYTLDDTVDEEFDGVIYRLAIPRDFLSLVEKIKAFAESENGTPSNVASESFFGGSYSYTLATNKDGIPLSWREVFKGELIPYRKMFPDIKV